MYVLSVYINNCKGGLVLCYNLLIFPLYRGDQFYWWRKPEYPEKNTYIYRKSLKTISHNVVSNISRPERNSNS
jgi:hypothetical protein